MPGSINNGRPLAVDDPNEQHYQHAINDRGIEEGYVEEYAEKPPLPTKRKFYKKKKFWIICLSVGLVIFIVVLLLILFVAFPKIAQSIMNKANLSVREANISFSNPQTTGTITKRDGEIDTNSTFYMSMVTDMSNTGPFHADIKFQNPIEVYYNETMIGSITLPDSKIAGGKGVLEAVTPFVIADTAYFAAFTREMLAREKFTWTLKGKLKITALTRTATIDLNKDIVLEGMNGFPEVSIKTFNFPSDSPTGGINVELGTVLVSPSPIGVQLGTIKMSIAYSGVTIGQVSAENIVLAKGDNNIMLKGVLTPQNDTASLDKVSELFSAYMAGRISQTSAVGISCAPNGVDPVGWLSEGFKTVSLNVALGSSEAMKVIHGINMGYLDLVFNKDAPYAPILSASQVVADFSIPFGFTLNITEVAQSINLGTNDTGDFGNIQVPMSPSISDQVSGKLQFAMINNTLTAIAGKETAFNQYTYSLTSLNDYTFNVAGNATTKANTPIGPLVLSGIAFNVPTTLHGLQFLNSSATVINSLDVSGGTSEGLELAISVTMQNPSDFSISTGDVSFNMLADSTKIGLVQLNNLVLQRGANTIVATASFDPMSSDVGKNLLSTFVMGKDNAVSIGGYEGSTAIASLADGLAKINLDTTLPGLNATLIQSTALIVLPASPSNGVVNVKVALANPFTTGLSITKIVSSVSYQGMPVGNIDQDISNNPFIVTGKSTGISPELDMTMNLEPAVIALLMRQLAVVGNLDTRPLDALLTLGGFHIEGQEQVSADASLFENFNLSSFVMEAMKNLIVDIQLDSVVNMGQYTTALAFSQPNVITTVDDTIAILIPIVGQPIVQQIVDGAALGFDSIVMSAPTDTGFKVQMKGSITGTGPMQAAISFPDPLTVAWQGTEIGKVTMAAILAKPMVGAVFDVAGEFTITNTENMANFATYMINADSFVWDIYTNNVNVEALGFKFTDIKMEKFVTLTGAKGFKDCVTISNFTMPSNVDNGIALVIQSSITNPSTVGFDFSSVSFDSYYGSTKLGPLSSDGGAVFPSQAKAAMVLKGYLQDQHDSPSGLKAVNEVFTNYISAKDSIVSVKGTSVSGPNGEVGWLTTAFKALNIENVILPGPSAKPKLITAVTMKNMQLDFTTKNPYAPPASSTLVEAQLDNPFGFPLGVSSLNMNISATYGGNGVAALNIPDNKATTSATGVVSTSFSDVPFSVYDPSRPLFDAFVKLLTAGPGVEFGLEGLVNSVAVTKIGDFNLNNIELDVPTSLAGFSNFGGKASILSLTVSGGTREYIEVSVKVSFTNPSAITITIGDINFDTIVKANGANIGTVYLKNVVIAPGDNVFDSIMHMHSTNLPALSSVLTSYLTNTPVPLTVAGTENSTTIAPLKGALSTVSLDTVMPAIQADMVVSSIVRSNIADIIANVLYTDVTMKNPLATDITILQVYSNITYLYNPNGPFKVGHIDYTLPTPFTIPAGGQATSTRWPITIEGEFIELVNMMLNPEKYVELSQIVTCIVGGPTGFIGQMLYPQEHVYNEIHIAEMEAVGLNAVLGSMGTNTTASANVSSSAVPVASSASVPVASSTSEPTSAASADPTSAAAEPTSAASAEPTSAAAEPTSADPEPTKAEATPAPSQTEEPAKAVETTAPVEPTPTEAAAASEPSGAAPAA
ncbi:hypothetical protein J3Q64DRAFT_1811555 [Phycomyces blakesleeanus]|uniref:Uncharacterized protein n=3 Tax=Phycomyces blakesleeanus TaxID=4837 RepID=A0ABR3AK30_PHYBL